MTSVPDADLERLWPHTSARHLEGLEGIRNRGGQLLGYLFYELTAAWTGGMVDPRRGNFSDLAQLYRCETCSMTVHGYKQRLGNGCQHRADAAWNVNAHVALLHKETRSWQRTYWRLWGQVHHFLCPRCRVYFAAEQMTFSPSRDPTRLSATHFACCNRLVRERDFLNNLEGGCVSQDVCRTLYDTLGVYLSRVRRDQGSAVDTNEECNGPGEPIIDMSVIRRADRKPLLVLEPSKTDQYPQNSSGSERASCKDESNNKDTCSWQQNVERWFCDTEDVNTEPISVDKELDLLDTEEPMSNVSLLGPHGDSPAFPGKQSMRIDKDVWMGSKTHSTPNKKLNPIRTEYEKYSPEETASEQMLPTTQDDECEVEESGSEDSEWVPKTTQDDESNAENEESDDGGSDASEWMPKVIQDECEAEDSVSQGSQGSEWMPKITEDDKSNAEESGSNSSEWIPTTMQDDNYGEEESRSDNSEWQSITIWEDTYGIEDDISSEVSSESSEKYTPNFGSNESVASSKLLGETDGAEEQQMGEESDHGQPSRAARKKLNVDTHGRRRHQHYHHWHSHLSRTQNQINQHNLECHENEQIIHYLTSKIYNLRKATCRLDELSSDDEAARSKWMTHIVPREGAYAQIEREIIGPRTRRNRSQSVPDTQCEEEIDICTSFLYELTSDYDLLEQNE